MFSFYHPGKMFAADSQFYLPIKLHILVALICKHWQQIALVPPTCQLFAACQQFRRFEPIPRFPNSEPTCPFFFFFFDALYLCIVSIYTYPLTVDTCTFLAIVILGSTCIRLSSTLPAGLGYGIPPPKPSRLMPFLESLAFFLPGQAHFNQLTPVVSRCPSPSCSDPL